MNGRWFTASADDELTIYERSKGGRRAFVPPELDVPKRALDQLLAPELRRQQLVQRPLWHIELRRHECPPAALGALVDRQLVIGRRGEPAPVHARAPTGERSAATAAPSTSARRSISALVRRSVIATSSPSSNSSG